MDTIPIEPEAALETFSEEGLDPAPGSAEIVQPPVSPHKGLLTYEPYYGLTEKPFSLSPDPRFLFKSESHAPVFQDLLAAIRRREGLVVLTGDIGTGKTTLCRAVLGQLDGKTFTSFVPDPFVSREDLLKTLLVDFGVISIDDVRRGHLRGASRVELSYPLYDFLKSLEPLDAFAVLIIDEVQNLSLPLLEEIRILSDLEVGRKLLQVVLVGQPEFRAHLKQPRMRQVDQRVTLRRELRPLTREGVFSYVAHRLATAGAVRERVSFATSSLDLIYEASGGVPRVINLICDRALERGCRSESSIIGPGMVVGAVGDLQLGTPTPDFGLSAAARPAGDTVTALFPADALSGAGIPVAPGGALGSSRGRAARLAAALSLAGIGMLTGIGLVTYFLWMRPLIAEGTNLPPLPQLTPSVAVTTSMIMPVGSPAVSAAAPAQAAGKWAIQAAAFTSVEEVRALIRRLAADGFPAFEGPLHPSPQGIWRLVLVGPFATASEARLALAQLRQMPDFSEAILTNLDTGPEF